MSKNRRRKPEQQELPVETTVSDGVVAIPKPENEREAEAEPEPFATPEPEPEPEMPRRADPVVILPSSQPDRRPPAPKPKPCAKTERIGDLLREARLARGDDLYLIAEYLCIKPSFLIALENSRYDEFPADAYVIGFLRTYANFLGIDGKEAIDRYRYEMAGRRKKPILSMPTPVSEGRAPSGLVMVAAAVAIFIVYALWYGISSANRAQVHVPPPLPTTTQPAPQTSIPDPSAAGLTAPVAASTSAPVSITPPSPAPVAEQAPPPPAKATEAAKPVETEKSADSAKTPAAGSSTLVIPPAAPGIVVTAGKGAPEPVDDIGAKIKEITKDSKAAKNAKEDKVKEDAAKEEDAAKAEAKQPVYGETGSGSRVTVRATQNSWIMVIDDSGRTVFDRILKPGESYRVPANAGLSLTTGNGGGIELSVDGHGFKKAAKGSGMVRNISLDPARISAE